MTVQPDLFTDHDAELAAVARRLVRREHVKAVHADNRFARSNWPGEPRVPTAPAWKWVLDLLEDMNQPEGEPK